MPEDAEEPEELEEEEQEEEQDEDELGKRGITYEVSLFLCKFRAFSERCLFGVQYHI